MAVAALSRRACARLCGAAAAAKQRGAPLLRSTAARRVAPLAAAGKAGGRCVVAARTKRTLVQPARARAYPTSSLSAPCPSARSGRPGTAGVALHRNGKATGACGYPGPIFSLGALWCHVRSRRYCRVQANCEGGRALATTSAVERLDAG